MYLSQMFSLSLLFSLTNPAAVIVLLFCKQIYNELRE